MTNVICFSVANTSNSKRRLTCLKNAIDARFLNWATGSLLSVLVNNIMSL